MTAQHQHMIMTGNLGVAGGGGSERAAIQDLQQRVWDLEEAAGIAHAPPEVRDVPHAQGDGVPGTTVNCTMGNWENEPDTYAYQWLKTGMDIPDATAADYTVLPEDVGTELSCKVTATNEKGSASSTSNPVPIVETPPAKQAPVPQTAKTDEEKTATEAEADAATGHTGKHKTPSKASYSYPARKRA